jgi:hypothetical protein
MSHQQTNVAEQASPSSADNAQNAASSECQVISEKQFLRDHTYYSAISSWLFAIAGATNIGVLCAFSSKILMAAEQGKPFFKSKDPNVVPVFGNKKYNSIALGMTAFGAVCMAVSNWLESKKVVTEWQLGAGKLQRKANIAEKHQAECADTQPQTQAQATDTHTTPPHCKNWVASVQAKTADNIDHTAQRLRHG